MIKNLIFDLDDTIIKDEKSDALVAVKEEYRKLGIATKLMKQAEEIARTKEIKKIWLFSGFHRKDAHELYKKLGYDEEDYWQVYCAIDRYEEIFTEEKNLYDKKELIDFINKVLDRNYSYELMDELLRVAEYWTENLVLSEETVKKLSEKYNLYIYTNYFQKLY